MQRSRLLKKDEGTKDTGVAVLRVYHRVEIIVKGAEIGGLEKGGNSRSACTWSSERYAYG